MLNLTVPLYGSLHTKVAFLFFVNSPRIESAFSMNCPKLSNVALFLHLNILTNITDYAGL